MRRASDASSYRNVGEELMETGIRGEASPTAARIIAASEEPAHLAEALKAGAAGYVLKIAPPQQVVGAMRRALEGEAPLNQEVAREVILRLMDGKREQQEKQDEAGSHV